MSDKIFGTYTTNNRNKIKSKVNSVIALESKYKRMSDEELKKMTDVFRKRLQSGSTIEDIMIEAFAVCREATSRTLHMSHYPVQLEAAIAMHERVVTEMKTGEGKTLVQILNAYLNALDGKGVHVITSNDYLASRDSIQNSEVFNFLGLSCGFVEGQPRMNRNERREQYKKDIVYATASTIGFDYLDDNRVKKASERVFDRPFNYAIIDEVDSILLDDARVPLIKNGKAPESKKSKSKENEAAMLYEWATNFINSNNITCTIVERESSKNSENLVYTTDALMFKDTAHVIFSDKLDRKILEGKNFDPNNPEMQQEYSKKAYAVQNCLLAREYYKKGINYQLREVKPGVKEVVLVGAGTGRLLNGRRLGSGLHEAIEAKEAAIGRSKNPRYDVPIKKPSLTVATCTYPDLLSMYKNGISGMTGTSNSQEFLDIYGMPTYEVPSRKTNIRKDLKDELYITKKAKYNAIIKDILRCQKTLQPVLIGTTSVEESEIISKLLAEEGIRHQLLNAVKDENEAGIIANAGQLGKVTVATNMAGRGTDIKLGSGVEEVGGLYVIGTSRNNSKRVDNQLRGRAGRQGDPGQTKYFTSLEDDLVALRGSDKLKEVLQSLGKSLAPIQSKFIKSQVDRCQTSQESEDQAARISSEKYGSVLSAQKNQIYDQRNRVLDAKSILPLLKDIMSDYTDTLVKTGDMEEIRAKLGHLVNVDSLEGKKRDELKKEIMNSLSARLIKVSSSKVFEERAKERMIDVIDSYWIDHLDYLSESRMSSGFYALSQKNPLDEYKYNAYKRFQEIIPYIQNELITYSLMPEKEFGEYEISEIQSVENEMVSRR
jgi:preprotein translocase subunit SecA